MKTAIMIQGPTAAGKTATAIALAERLHTAVVSADSRQCYRQMDIGTAKPTPAELNRVPHYFIDEYPVTTLLTAADYESIALQHLETIFTANDYVVVCGGTGLYIKALCEGMDAMPPVDPSIAEEITAEYNLQGVGWLQAQVRQYDPAFYATGETDNPARMLRALIFIRSTNESITTYRTGIKKERDFRIIKIGLELPREALYARINARVDTMMQSGLEAEARSLYEYRHLKNLQTVGYSELFNYFDGQCTLPEAITKIKQHTRNYAKRQLTWFKKDKEIMWLQADDKDVVEEIMRRV